MFDPVRSYDKPGVIIHQIANGIASTDSVRRVLFDPAALSPRERESFADTMKREYGGNAVADTAIDVLTNPLVWLGVLTMGGGVAAQRSLAGGGRFFGAATGAGAYANSKFPWLRAIRLTSGMTESVGRRSAPLAQVAITHMEEARGHLSGIMEQEVGGLLQAVSRKHGVTVTRLEPENAPNPAVAKDLRLIRSWLAIDKMGWNQDRTERAVVGVEPGKRFIRVLRDNPDPTGRRKVRRMEVEESVFDQLSDHFNNKDNVKFRQDLRADKNAELLRSMPGLKKGESMLDSMNREKIRKISFRLGLKEDDYKPGMDRNSAGMDMASALQGGPSVKFETLDRRRLVHDQAALDAVENEFGLRRVADAQRRLYENGRVLLAGDEDAFKAGRGFVADDQKILRLARTQMQSLENSGYMTEGGAIEVGGEEAVRALLSDEVSMRLIRAAEGRTGNRIKQGATREEIEKVVVEAYKEGFLDPNYMPRNTVEAFDNKDRKIQYNPYTSGASDETGNYKPEVSGRTMMRNRKTELPWDPRDLEFIAENFGGTQEMYKLIGQAKLRIDGQKATDNMYRVHRVAPDIAAAKYVASTARDYACFAKDMMRDPHIQAIMRDLSPEENARLFAGPIGNTVAGGFSGGIRNLEDVPEDRRPGGGFTWYDLMDNDLRSQVKGESNDKFAVDMWRRDIIPAVMGIKPIEDGAGNASARVIREQARRLADSKFMRAVEGTSDYAARYVQQLRTWGNDAAGDGASPWQGVSRALYASHLGLNMGSALINLMQPLQSVHHLGFDNTVKAYGQSIKQMMQYAEGRSRLGLSPKQSEIEDLRKRIFTRSFGGRQMDLTAVADITSTWNTLEKAGYGTTPQVGKPQFRVLEAVMKMFQTSETLNRTVTANAVLNAYERAGRGAGMDFERAQQDATMAVQQLQFGSSPLNRPKLMYYPGLRNPAFRQFLQYGLRSFSNLFTVPAMIGGERQIAGRPIRSQTGVAFTDMMRGMAVSAVAYEVMKSSLGVDVSRGLMTGGPADLLGGDRALMNKNFPVYIPPVVDVGWDAARWLATGDVEILQDWAPRVIPGGIAISRALGGIPASQNLQALGLQKTFADWRQSESGMVPMFNADGRFMGQYPTSDVVLKSLGMDMGRFNNPQEVGQFLMKNRDAIRDGRRSYIAAVLGNNMSAAQKVKAQFEKRFGMPLTVTQAQMKDAIKLREESVISRTMETIDPTIRDQYREAVEQSLPGQLMTAQVPGAPMEQGDIYRWSPSKTKP